MIREYLERLPPAVLVLMMLAALWLGWTRYESLASDVQTQAQILSEQREANRQGEAMRRYMEERLRWLEEYHMGRGGPVPPPTPQEEEPNGG